MRVFNVEHRYFLNVSIDDGPVVTVEIEVSTEGEIRVKHDKPISPNQSIYLYLGPGPKVDAER